NRYRPGRPAEAPEGRARYRSPENVTKPPFGPNGPRPCGPALAPCATPRPATTATSCTSASPIWAGTCGPGTRLISPLPSGASPFHRVVGDQRRHQERASFGHQGGGRRVQQIPVLDGPDPVSHGHSDRLRRVGMGGHVTVAAGRLLGDDADLLRRVLRYPQR